MPHMLSVCGAASHSSPPPPLQFEAYHPCVARAGPSQGHASCTCMTPRSPTECCRLTAAAKQLLMTRPAESMARAGMCRRGGGKLRQWASPQHAVHAALQRHRRRHPVAGARPPAVGAGQPSLRLQWQLLRMPRVVERLQQHPAHRLPRHATAHSCPTRPGVAKEQDVHAVDHAAGGHTS